MKYFEQPHISGKIINKNVLYNNKISFKGTFSIKSFSESLNFLHPYDKMSNHIIEFDSFQSDFHDPIITWLEESYLKKLHLHLLMFDGFHFVKLEVLQWFHWLFHFT